jgi:hypothetical protein
MPAYTLKLISCRKVIRLQPGSIPGVGTRHHFRILVMDATIIWKNISNKTIKYITFECIPLNRINDPVVCEISRNGIELLMVIGPIKPGQTYGYGYLWEYVWYNPSIIHMKVISTEIVFM